MPLTDMHRKFLWGRSGGCCAICRCPLTEDETEADPAAVIGEEAHIVSGQKGGPRYRPMEPREVDHYSNVILVCPNHHARIDKQSGLFTESKIREIKAEHEKWVTHHRDPDRPVRIRDLKAGAPVPLYRATKGSEVVGVVGGSHAFQYDKPDDLTEDEVDLLGGFLQDLNDWMDIWGDLGPADRLRAELSVSRGLDALQAAGFVVHVGTRDQVLEGGIGPPSRWSTAVLVVHRSRDAQAQLKILLALAGK